MSKYIYPQRKNTKNSSSSSTTDIKGLSRVCSSRNQIKITKFMQRGRLSSKSNQQLQWELVGSHNPEASSVPLHDGQEKQLFDESFAKIKTLKAKLCLNSSSSLSQELNDIIDLLRGERVKAKLLMKDLKSECEIVEKTKSTGTNTDDMILEMHEDTQFRERTDCQTQTNFDSSNQDGKYRSYEKLVHLLQQAKIDYRKILPEWEIKSSNLNLPEPLRSDQTKALSNPQILKLQECFIKKLANQIKESQKKKFFIHQVEGKQEEEKNTQNQRPNEVQTNEVKEN